MNGWLGKMELVDRDGFACEGICGGVGGGLGYHGLCVYESHFFLSYGTAHFGPRRAHSQFQTHQKRAIISHYSPAAVPLHLSPLQP